MRLLSLLVLFTFSLSAYADLSFVCDPDTTTARRNREESALVSISKDHLTLSFTTLGKNGRTVIKKTKFTRTQYESKFTASADGPLTDEGDAFAYADQNMLEGRDGELNVDVEAIDLVKMTLIYGVYKCSVLTGSK